MVDSGTTTPKKGEVKSYAETIELVEVKNPKGQTARVYPIDFILMLRNLGAKILPTKANALAFNTEGLIAEEEFKACPEAMGGPTRFIYLNPRFWTDDRIKAEHWRFEGIRVLPGKTYTYHDGKISAPYRLYILDIDSYKAYEKLKELLETDLFLNTYVTESYKMRNGETFGHHVYWLEDWDDNDDCVSINPDDCKAGTEFEIFTGLKYTQIAGHHREHTGFYYHNVGCKNLKDLQFVIRNGLYNKILVILEGLLLNPEDIAKRRKSQKKYHDPFYGGKDNNDRNYDENFLNADTHTLTASQVQFAALWALPFYGAELNDSTKHYFHFTTAFIATLVRENITRKSINYITDMLCELNPSPKYGKGTWHSWCESSILTWKSGGAILGIPSLVKRIQKNPDYADRESASKHVDELLTILNATKTTKFSFKKDGSNQTNQTKYEIFRQKEYEYDVKLAAERLSEKDVDFAFQSAIIESPYDKTSIHQLLLGCLSAFTKTPISHILSSLVPGAGKNHLMRLTIGFIPDRYVVLYNRLSDRALFHMSGEMVMRRYDDTGKEVVEPIEGYLSKLNNRLRDLKRKAKKSKTRDDINEIDSIGDEIKGVLENTQKLIRLDNLIQVFLDTPPEGLWDACMSLLSQDAERDQFYTFTDRTDSNNGLGTKTSRLRGAPTIISAGVIDDTASLRFAEKNRRLVHVNPNTNKAKIERAIQATNDRRLGLSEEYEEDYISDSDKERAKHIFDVIISKIKLHCAQFGYMEAGIFLPKIIRIALRNSMNVKEGNVWSMTINDRLLRYLTVITLSKMDNRLKLVDKKTGQIMIIPTFADLKDTLNLMNRASSKIRPYVAEFYNIAILPTYNRYLNPNSITKDGKTILELDRGITDAQIAEYLKENGMEILDKDTIRDRFLDPLCRQGVLNKTKSEIDKRSSIYSPVKDYETGISSIFDDDQDPRLTVRDPECYPTIEKIQDQFFSVSRRPLREKGDIVSNRYEVKNFDQQKIDFAEMQNYLGNSDKCFKRGYHLNEHSKNAEKIEIKILEREYETPTFLPPQIPQSEEKIFPNFEDIKDCQKVGYNASKVSLFTKLLDINDLVLVIEKSISQIKENVKDLTPPKISNFEKFGSFDFEWYRSDLQANIDAGKAGLIYCAAFVDHLGNATTIHLEDFGYNYEFFIDSVLTEMAKYTALIGFSILRKEGSFLKKKGEGISGDIETLEKNCNAPSMPIEVKEKFANVMSNVRMLDIYPLFTSEHTKGILSAASKIRLRGDSLDAISIMYLGEGKLQDLSGPEVEPLESDVQKLYCLQDAILPMKLIQKENYKLLNIFSSLANECDLDPYRALNYCNTTTFWRGLLKKWKFERGSTELTRWQEKEIQRDLETGTITKGINYLGGEVLIPFAVGKFTDIVVWDVASMYPTMAIKHNISPETVMCDCCRDDSEAKISKDIMTYINGGLIEMGKKKPTKKYIPRPFHYWICKKQRGILPQIMDNLFEKKRQYKKSKMTSEEKGTKIAANSGYGVFANKFYEGYNIGVAELITGFARYALLGLKKEIENLGFSVIYGDTDSLFIKDIRPNSDRTMTYSFNQIIELAQSRYKVEFERDKIFKVFFIPSKKDHALKPSQKQYFGLLDNEEVYATTLVGMKSNYSKYSRNVMLKLIDPKVVAKFYSNVNDGKAGVVEIVREVFATFDKEISSNQNFIIDNLEHSENNTNPLSQYPKNGWQRQIFNEVLEDCKGDLNLAEQKTKAHTVIKFWRIKPTVDKEGKRKVWTCHPERYSVDEQDAKRLLWGRIESILDSYLFTKEESKRLKNVALHNITELS